MATLLLYPVRESNASLILRRDSFYPSELTRLISAGEYSKISLFYQAESSISGQFLIEDTIFHRFINAKHNKQSNIKIWISPKFSYVKFSQCY